MLSLTVCPSTTQRSCHPLSEASLSQGHTQGHRAGGWAGRTSSARTEKPSSLAHADVETSFLPEAGYFLGEGKLQHPCCSGKDPSRGSHKPSSCATGFPKQMGCLGSAACRGFGENFVPQSTSPWPIANTGTCIPQERDQGKKTCFYGVTKAARWAANTPGRQQQHLGVRKCLLGSCRTGLEV